MTEYASDLLRLLSSRGYIHQVTDAQGLDALAAKQVVPGSPNAIVIVVSVTTKFLNH